MSTALCMFPRLEQELFHRQGFEASPFLFYYEYNGQERELEVNDLGDGTNLGLSDPRGEWNPDEYGFTVKRECVIRHPQVLFGPNGVAPSGATIGMSVLWLSRSSSMRGAATFNEPITNHIGSITRFFEHRFLPGSFRGEVILKTELYLAECLGTKKDESHLAKYPGTLLGELDVYRVRLDGNGSLFPIATVNEPTQPLWRVECNWSDPLTEPFDSDAVVVYLNSAHPGYKELNETKTSESYLLKEVIAGALEVVVHNAQSSSDTWQDIMAGRSEEGSIGQALHYFVTTLDWKTDSPERLALSIRAYLDRGM